MEELLLALNSGDSALGWNVFMIANDLLYQLTYMFHQCLNRIINIANRQLFQSRLSITQYLGLHIVDKLKILNPSTRRFDKLDTKRIALFIRDPEFSPITFPVQR